jgi:hypothetical protein
MEGVTLAEAQCEADTDTELDTEGDTVARKEPVSPPLTEGLPDSDACGEAQGVTVCVAGTVRDTEAEDVPLGEPLVVLRAERVWDRVTETVPVWDTEGVEEGDTEPLPRPGLPEGELEPLDAGVAEPHTVTVTETVEVAEGEPLLAREGDEEADTAMDAVTVEEAEVHTVPVVDARAERVRPDVVDTVVLADTLGLLLGEVEPDAQPVPEGEMEREGDTLGEEEGDTDTVALLSTVDVEDSEGVMVAEREPVWVSEVEGVLVAVMAEEGVKAVLPEDLGDADVAAEGVLELHTLEETQPEGDREAVTDAVKEVLCVEDTEGEGETDVVMGAEAESPAERESEGDTEEEVQWVEVAHEVGVHGLLPLEVPEPDVFMEADAVAQGVGESDNVPDTEGDALSETVNEGVAVWQSETDTEPLWDSVALPEGDGVTDGVTRAGGIVPETEFVCVGEKVFSRPLALTEGDAEGEPDTEGEKVAETVTRADSDTVVHGDGEKVPVWVTLALDDTDGEPVTDTEEVNVTLAQTDMETVPQGLGDEEGETSALPERAAEAVRPALPVANKLGVCVGDRVSAMPPEGDTDAVAVREGDAVCVGEKEGEPDGEIEVTVDPVRAALGVATAEKVGD